tara:strand:+ start:197 stop:439 length:243 start_codon:yes stop_codon:yes gene_type:complete
MKTKNVTMQHGCYPGDIVRNKNSESGETGLFIGLRTFKGRNGAKDYECAEVMWFDRNAPNGDRISTIQTNLIETVLDESR